MKKNARPWICWCQVTVGMQFQQYNINRQCVTCRPDLAGTNDVKLGIFPLGKKEWKRRMVGLVEKSSRKSVAFVSEQEGKLASLLDQITSSNTSNLAQFKKELHSNVSKSHCPKSIARDNALDYQLLEELNSKRGKDNLYFQAQTFRSQLPVFTMKKVMLDMINENQVSLISGQTGSGKTTQVAQFVLDQHIEQQQGSKCHIICTQPRRISAISVAQRVAYERGEKLGQSCGYQIRLDNLWPRRQGSILFCTPGVLLRTMIVDPTVSRASHLIIDEVHERDIYTDFLLIVIKAALLKRADLKVILMSATLNADSFSSYFYGCPTLNVPGRTHPVKEVFLEELLALMNFKVPAPKELEGCANMGKLKKENKIKKLNRKRHGCVGFPEYLSSIKNQYSPEVIENLTNMDFGVIPYKLIIATVAYICEKEHDQGAILIFLPGWKDIDNLITKFKKDHRFKNSEQFLILPIHSKLDTALQREVFVKPQAGCRKIILGTNIVETSVTIDDIVYIIDTGKSKESSFDTELGFATLTTGWVSKASLIQRQGRAGRVKPGICYRLFTQHHKESFDDFPTPEIVKTPLPQLCLTTKVLKVGKIWPFFSQALTPPTENSCKIALKQLEQMQALDSNENLTVIGYYLAHLPVPPNIGRMMIFSALFSCLDPILTIAAAQEGRDVSTLVKPDDSGNMKMVKKDNRKTRWDYIAQECQSDHLTLIRLIQEWEGHAGNPQAQRAYAQDEYLQNDVLSIKMGLKRKFMIHLKRLGLVDVVDPKEPSCNVNSNNMALLRALLCAGLYPNVALVTPHKRKDARRKIKVKGKLKKFDQDIFQSFGAQDIKPAFFSEEQRRKNNGEIPQLHIHPSSFAQQYIDNSTRYILFSELIKIEQCHNVFKVTPVTPYSLLLFGGHIEYCDDDSIVLDGHNFSGSQKTVQLIKDVRKQLDRILTGKIGNPEEGQSDEDRRLDEEVLHAIIDIITNETKRPAVEDTAETDDIEEEEGGNGDNGGEEGASSSNEFPRPQSSNPSSTPVCAPNSFDQSNACNDFSRPFSNSSYQQNAADKSIQKYGQAGDYSRLKNLSRREGQHSTYKASASSHSFREEEGWRQDSYQHSVPSDNSSEMRVFSNSSFQQRPSDNYFRIGPSNSSHNETTHNTFMRRERAPPRGNYQNRVRDGFSCLWAGSDNNR